MGPQMEGSHSHRIAASIPQVNDFGKLFQAWDNRLHKSRNLRWHSCGSLGGMARRILLLLAAGAAALLLMRGHAVAQDYFETYGTGTATYFPIQSGYTYYYTYTPRPPAATHDSRMDPHLLKAARIAESKAYQHSTMRCWHFVKEALVAAGAVSAYPVTSYAAEAGQELTSHFGFVRLPIHDPYRAPVGSVLVYQGAGGMGHVEFRTEHGFASDYRSPWRCKYRLTGVYAKLSA